ncbi:hypothetical protein CDN99_00935 [Roseateles aquatilis]|uniref:histidine kinase n=1 Tax=Roseateles aquatilis TaxID=431061 RepID=A0A246JKN9_9BURK|nr:ATP-binding protein [Roseateles aquatilis]OWQ93100.1 hypothetical protein CDN99_00935 [Roseateles aquatilis]
MRRLLGPWLRPSLFRRLYSLVVLLLCGVLLSQCIYVYRQLIAADGEAVLRDLQLTAQAYADLLSAPGLEDAARAHQARLLVQVKVAMTEPTMRPEEFAYRVWSSDGRVLAASGNGPALDFASVRDGAGEARRGDQVWRTYAARSANGALTVVVAQPLALYHRAGAELMEDAGWTMLIIAAVAIVLVGVSAHAGLRPLRTAAHRLAARDPRDLSPLVLPARHAELAPLLDAIDGLFARMSRMLDAERQFFADAAHELRTPLAAMNAQAHVLAHSRDAHERAAALAALEQGVQRSSELAAKLLLLSRLEVLDVHAPRRLVDVAALARERLAHVAGVAGARRIELSYQGDDHARASLDPEAAVSILDNLLDNALRHASRGGRVDVEVRGHEAGGGAHRLELRVADTGVGVPPSERERIFERFYRVPGNDGSGSGLGLAIVRRVVDLHAGRVRVEDTPGGGATFVVELPALSPCSAVAATAQGLLSPLS